MEELKSVLAGVTLLVKSGNTKELKILLLLLKLQKFK